MSTLDIISEHLLPLPPSGYDGIEIPATGSVKNYPETTGKTLLEFRIRSYNVTTKRRCEAVCASWEKREGKEEWNHQPD